MWAEIIIPRDDLRALLGQALPLTISFGPPESPHSLALSDLAEVELVADRGLRVVCKAHLTWPLLGIKIPITVSSVKMLLLPTIGRSPEGDTLAFRISIEHADFSGLPTMIDNRITDAINAKLAEKDVELSWNFSRSLTFRAKLPAMLESLESFAIRPAWGEVRVTEEAVVYAASFHAAFVREGASPPDDVVAPAAAELRSPAAR
jgi:hypothetical protein